MRELSLFSGAGGGLLASKHLLNWKTIGYVEIDEYCQKVLRQRITDGYLDPAPIFGDIRKFISEGYAESYKGMVDVVSGGFPCQDISCQGSGKGIDGEKSGLWKEMFKVVCKVKPKYVFVENSPALVVRGLGTVLRDLATMGFNARWGVFSAADAGAPHIRERIWILADSNGDRLAWCRPQTAKIEHTLESFLLQHWPARPGTQSDIPRMANGLANKMDRIKAIGNGQVPQVAALAWKILTETEAT